MEEENPFCCGEWTPKDRNYPPTAAMLPPVIAEDVHDYDMFPMPDCVTNAQEIVTSWHEDHRHLVAHAIVAQKKHEFGNPMSPAEMTLIRTEARQNYAVAKGLLTVSEAAPLSVYDMFPLPAYTALALDIMRDWHQDKENLQLHAMAVQKQYNIVSPMSVAQRAFVKKCSEDNYAFIQLAFVDSQEDWL